MPLLALWLALAVGARTAHAQGGPELRSIQLDGGMFAPLEANGASPTAGMRYCKHYGSHLQGGLLTGWTLKSSKVEAPAAGPQSSGAKVELARADAQLVPVMAFMQVDLTDRFLVPFVGIGAGYEWLLFNAIDHRTGVESKTYFGNVAWETYAGMGLRLTSRVRVNSELYYNGASLERNLVDSSGRTWREAVHMNGVGARVGLDMTFE